MTMTIMAAAAEVGSLGEPDMESLAKAISSGSLRGARGNSGVILSQLLRGFTRSVKNSKELDAIDIAAAMEKGVETAYKAVMKPKEGTILTVAREAAAKAVELAETAEDLDTFFQSVIAHAEETLAKTPEMLPVLKEAGVVIPVDRDFWKYTMVHMMVSLAKRLIIHSLTRQRSCCD